MTWTYSTALTTSRDKIRLRVGDTDTNDQLLSDEEIAYVLTERTTVSGASAECVRRILAKLARKTDRSAVGLSSSRSQLTQHYRDLLRDLEREECASASPQLVGVAQSEVDSENADSDYNGPQFTIGQDDPAGTLSQETDE